MESKEQTVMEEMEAQDSKSNGEEILSQAMDEQKQQDFYRKLRSKMSSFIEKHPNSKYLNYVVAAPDFFYLLCKLTGDKRVPMKNKAVAAGAILYFISPIDIISDALPGIGIVDDVILAINVVNGIINSVGVEVVEELWPGEKNVMEQIKTLLDFADSVVGKGMISKIMNYGKKKNTPEKSDEKQD